MSSISNTTLRGFAVSGDELVNRLEMSAFLASATQETGDPALDVPYPWAVPPLAKKAGPEYMPGAGGMLSVLEGLSPSITLVDNADSKAPFAGALTAVAPLNERQAELIGTGQKAIAVSVISTQNANQAGFGLGTGTNTGVIWQPGLCAVSDDGTLYCQEPRAEQATSTAHTFAAGSDRKTACFGAYCQYSGRGVQQLRLVRLMIRRIC